MPLTNGSGFKSGSRSFYFHFYLQDANKKRIFFKKFFCLVLFEGTFTSFFKDKKSKRSHKTVEIKVFLAFLLNDRRVRIQIHEAQKHVDPDPDLEHWLWYKMAN
jgi:hypothetical protein